MVAVVGIWLVGRHAWHGVTWFVVGVMLNNVLQVMLKRCLRQPRPLPPFERRSVHIALTHGRHVGWDKFGMPSGHAQNAAFVSAFATLDNNGAGLGWWLVGLLWVASAWVCVERWVDGHHTWLQIVVGVVVGSGMGVATWWRTRQSVQRATLEPKRDDDNRNSLV